MEAGFEVSTESLNAAFNSVGPHSAVIVGFSGAEYYISGPPEQTVLSACSPKDSFILMSHTASHARTRPER